MSGGKNVIRCLWLPCIIQTVEKNTNALFTFLGKLGGGWREREKEDTCEITQVAGRGERE